MSTQSPAGDTSQLVARLRELHKPFGIHDECDCPRDYGAGTVKHDGPEVVNCGDYETCQPATYLICKHCCADADEDCCVSERCHDTHDHGPGKPICETAAILDAHAAAGRDTAGGGQ